MTEKQTLLRSVGAYVPDFIIREIMADSSTPLLERERRMRAVLLFADVSGFTAMSESLAQLGKEGAEELTRVLNDYFTVMIDLVRSYGGQVIKFGGDAITCQFDNGEPGILRACACGLAMQREMTSFQAVETRGGVFALRMKIGISAGSVLLLYMGSQQEGLEYVLAGHPLDRMSQAEKHATAGEVVLDGECVPDVAKSGILVGEEREGKFLLVRGLAQEVEAAAGEAAARPAPDDAMVGDVIERLVPFLPPTVYEQIVEGQRQFVGEHRRVVSLFVNFAGLAYDEDPQAGRKLQRYFAAIQSITHRYGGRLNRISTGDKGNLLHLIFGAPVTHEDDEERALGCALAIQREVAESEELSFITGQRVGVACGYVFAGDVGSERRREYTVMGDVVNLSARLMQAAAPGEILIDQDTAHRVQETFVCQPLPPIRVKGKREPVSVCRTLGMREEAKAWDEKEEAAHRHKLPIVGRDQELKRLQDIVSQASAGQGQLLVINGEAGVGKSRLVEELVSLGRAHGMEVAGGNCLSYGSQSPYLPWIEFFGSFFGLSADGESRRDKMLKIKRKMVMVDPALADWVPIIAQLLGLAVPDNELTASLDGQLRKQRTFDITLALLRYQAHHGSPLLLVFEDVHWIDAISLEMLNYVGRNVADHPILLAAVHRPTIELNEWKRYDHYHEIALTDLPAEDALQLVRSRLGLPEVPAPLREQVLRGEPRVNPFFVEEVVNSLVDQGYLSPAKGGGYELVGDLAQAMIPDSIQTLVMSRIDRLDESSKLTVKVASVIGRTFKYRTLQGIYPVPITPARLRENLNQLSALDLTPLDRPAPDWEYIFKHIITQEVAYESLLYAHRRTLHHRVGEYLEQTYPDTLEEVYELLAYHYTRSGDKMKSWDYLVKAGDKAKEQYANEAAIAHYEQALSLGAEHKDAYRVYESLGDVYRLIGQYDKAMENYQQVLAHHPPTVVRTADVQRKMARTLELQGQYEEARHYLDQARATLGDHRETVELARIYGDMGWVAMRRTAYEEALEWCEKGLAVADNLNEEKGRRARASLEHNLGSIYWRMGNYPQAIAHFQSCIEMQEGMGDLYRLSGSLNNLAVVHWSQSDYDLAGQTFRRSLEISQRIGDTYGTAMCYNNLGVIAYTLGDYLRAVEQYEQSLQIRKEIGDLLGIADVYVNLGEVHQALGNHDQALDYLGEAVGLFAEIGDKGALFDAHKLLAEVNLELGDTAEATEHASRALEIAQGVGNREQEGIAYRVLGQVDRAAGRPEEAVSRLQHSVETLATVGNRLELGKSLYERGLALSAMGHGGREELEQAAAIFQELGVEGELEKAQAALHRWHGEDGGGPS